MDIETDTISEDTHMSTNHGQSTIDGLRIEQLWAQEQYEMPQRDREAASYELHGVESRYDAVEYEKPGNLIQALLEFDYELNNPASSVNAQVKKNYHRALSMNSSYVKSRDLRLRFLRAEFFEVTKAVTRFCKYLNLLERYFGDVCLMRQLLLKDLTKRELKLLKEGSMQFSPSRDSLGRRVMFFVGNCGAKYSVLERNRVGLYLLFQLGEDMRSQQNGIVTVHLMTEDVYQRLGGESTADMSSFFYSMFEACPFRFSAIHMCFPNELIVRLLKPLMLFLIGKTGRKVLKIHSGETVEYLYSLSSFGVRPEDIPTTYSGTVKTRQHMRWMNVRCAMDEHIENQAMANADCDYSTLYKSKLEPFPHIYCPEINCVLFHKNGVAWEFPGNIKFRAFLDEEFPINNEYTKHISTLEEDILNRIIRLALSRCFQFLLHDHINHWYDELTEPDQLRRYVGFAYRGHLRRCSAQRLRQGGRGCGTERKNRSGGGTKKERNEESSGCLCLNKMDSDVCSSNKTPQHFPSFTNMDGVMATQW